MTHTNGHIRQGDRYIDSDGDEGTFTFVQKNDSGTLEIHWVLDGKPDHVYGVDSYFDPDDVLEVTLIPKEYLIEEEVLP